MGEPEFSCRELVDIRKDIDMLVARNPRLDTVFFGDADPLSAGMDVFTGAARYVRSLCPLKRLTCYARASTLYKLGASNIGLLAAAGLNRVHLGLESGDEEILRFQRKGQSRKMVVAVAGWLKDAGIELSCYVLLGLGGQNRFEQHARATAELLNEIEPEFIRLRRLWLYGEGSEKECPLIEQVRSGSFIPQTPEGTVIEVKLLLEHLQPLNSFFACDHANNYIQISGLLKEERAEMLREVLDFLALPEQTRMAQYNLIGSRI